MKVSVIEAPLEVKRPLTFLLASDIHFGAKAFNADLWARFCAEASEPDTWVLINGDLFDAIFPTDRKRFTLAGSTQTHDGAINEVMDRAEEFFKPLASKIAWIGYGNHETACIKFNNFDPIQDLCTRLRQHRDPALPPIQRGAYKGFIRLSFKSPEAKRYLGDKNTGGGRSARLVIFADHGTGGAPEVTKGSINLERLYATYEANVYWMGHVHKSLYDCTRYTIGIGHNGDIQHKKKHGLVTGTFQKPFGFSDTDAPYSLNHGEEKFSGVQSSGYARLRVWFHGDSSPMHFEIQQVVEE